MIPTIHCSTSSLTGATLVQSWSPDKSSFSMMETWVDLYQNYQTKFHVLHCFFSLLSCTTAVYAIIRNMLPFFFNKSSSIVALVYYPRDSVPAWQMIERGTSDSFFEYILVELLSNGISAVECQQECSGPSRIQSSILAHQRRWYGTFPYLHATSVLPSWKDAIRS